VKVYEPENREDEFYELDRQRKDDDDMDTKLCKDCNHRFEGAFGSSKCGRTGNLDLVNGGQVFTDCIIERSIGDCGEQAVFFSPKIKVAA
jgi:hypothetical protein